MDRGEIERRFIGAGWELWRRRHRSVGTAPSATGPSATGPSATGPAAVGWRGRFCATLDRWPCASSPPDRAITS